MTEAALEGLAADLGAGIVEVDALSSRGRPRPALRVHLSDGRIFKVRHFKGAGEAADNAARLRVLDALGVPQPVWRRGAWLALEWIRGEACGREFGDAPLRIQAAHWLARLHTTPRFEGRALPRATPAAETCQSFEGRLGGLLDAGLLDPSLAERLRGRVRRASREPVLQGLAHGDFGPENCVVDERGALRPVDNEGLHVGVLDLDLARVWAREALHGSTWRAFLADYAEAAGRAVPEATLRPWKICALVQSAWYRFRFGTASFELPLGRLRSIDEEMCE